MEQVVKDFLREIGYSENIIDNEQEKRVSNWLRWYKGKPKEYKYKIYNGKKFVSRILKSLEIIPQSCSDLSDFFFNEKLEITIDNKQVDEKIKDCLKQNNFLSNSNKLMQLVKALGTGAYVPYLKDNVLKINYIKAPNIIILDGTQENVNSVLFWTISKKLDKEELIINAHLLKDEGYVIYNRKYEKDKNGDFKKVTLPDDLEYIETKSFLPKFSVLFTTEVNNHDINSPYGISCYANALDIVLSLDRAYDSFDNEINLGKKRVYVPANRLQFNISESGETVPVFDENDVTFYTYPGKDNDKLEESDFKLRIEEITSAIQAQLNLYTSKIGLGNNFYKFKDGQVYVNTDNVISTNSDLFRKIRKQENIITQAITDLIYAIAELIGVKEKFSISIFYDDSIIEDTEKIKKQALSEYNAKLISKPQYFRNVYKLKDKEAIKFVDKMNKEIVDKTITDGTEFELTE